MESKIRDLRQEIFKFEQLSNFDKNDFIGKEELIKRKNNPQKKLVGLELVGHEPCLLYTSPSPRD